MVEGSVSTVLALRKYFRARAVIDSALYPILYEVVQDHVVMARSTVRDHINAHTLSTGKPPWKLIQGGFTLGNT